MQKRQSFVRAINLTLIFLLAYSVSYSQSDFYWAGGSGDWDDASHWFKDAAGVNTTGVIPGSNAIVHFTNNSFSSNSKTLTIPPGSYDVHSILVETNEDFLFDFGGIDNNVVVMNVYGNLSLQSTHRLEYATSANPENSNNKWVFKRTSNQQNISTGNQDLLRVEFVNAGVTFNQLSNLKASQQILMLNGTWNTNGHNVNAGVLLFNDGLPSNATRVPRVFNTAGSDIQCNKWESRNTYGSLTLVGSHVIYVNEFKGSPANGGPPFTVDEIHLLEYPDNTDGSTSTIDHNNFECTDCVIESMIIEDASRVKLAGAFTVNGKLTIVEPGTSIEFSGGNLRSNEVTLNGAVITPKITGCLPRTIFKNVHNDFTSLLRSSGSLTINDAILENIQASGGANFILSGGVLQGSSSGWNVSNPPNPTNYYWLGDGDATKDWNDPSFWTLSNGSSNGCVPSIVDNVYIDSGSKGGIRIPANYTAECNNFTWTNGKDLDLRLDGTSSLESILKVTGSFVLEESATITPVGDHRLIFSSSSNNDIETAGVQLPNIKFMGDDGEWLLAADLSCDRLDFEGGTLKTQGNNVTTDLWTSLEANPKHYEFSSSRITVNGTFTLSLNNNSGVTVDPGTSLIACETLISSITDLYDVQMNNASTRTLGNYAYNFNKLILNGAGQLNTQQDLTVNTIEFMAGGSVLSLDVDELLTVNHRIIGTVSSSSPGVLNSGTSGTRAEIESDGNLCTQGYVSFMDIQSIMTGIFHAPDGIDGGNNDGITYDSGSTSNTLYWIGDTGGTWQVRKNWSRVDGGCPATKDPSDSPNLEFNRNSFTTTPVTITIFEGETANNIYFKNSENLTIDVRINLIVDSTVGPGNIFVDGGYVNFVGKTLDVSGKVDIQSSGFMTTDMNNFITNELDASSGAFVVRSLSTAKIREITP